METTTPKARAQALLAQGDLAAAVDALREAVAVDPDDDTAHGLLGTALLATGRVDEAIEALREAVAGDGSDAFHRHSLGRALARAARLDEAAFQLLQAAKLAPDDPEVAFDLGLVFYEKRLYDKAVTWLTKASVADAENARIPYALGLANEGQRDFAAAITAYREALRRDPTHIDARKTLADALASVGEHDAALEELGHVLRLEPTNEQAAHNREVLARVLTEMRARCLLGKTEVELGRSALVQEGGFIRKGALPAAENGDLRQRYTRPWAELWVSLRGGIIRELFLLLPNPERAAQETDEVFRVTVIGENGAPRAADLGTAVTLTFLREALGCPLTAASELFSRLLAHNQPVEWGNASLGFVSVPRPDRPAELRHGLSVRLR